MSNTNRTTKRMYFAAIADYARNTGATFGTFTADEIVNFINHEVELLDRKAERKSDKLTDKQKEDIRLMNCIYDSMENDKSYTIADIIAVTPELAGLNPQKVTPLVTKLVDGMKVMSNKEKGRNRYTKI